MTSIVEYFSKKPIVANVLMFGLIFTAILIWQKTGKEEMPEFAMNWVRVSIPFPGASAEDIELFVTKPIEEKLKGITSLEEVQSTSSYGTSSFRISFETNTPNLQEKIQEVKDAIDSVNFPREVDQAVYRQFRSSEKAIIDIGIYLKDTEILDVESRALLQRYALAFKEKLISLPEISGVESSGYLKPELQIQAIPDKLRVNEVSMDQIQTQVVGQHVRKPIGSMKDKGESDITLIGELDTVESLSEVIVSSGFRGQKLKLSELANIEHEFERNNQVIKVQGREGIVFNIQKSSSVDILSAQKAIINYMAEFKENLPDSRLGFVLMDDESYDVRNRISLIASNGLIGFCLIILILFLFLDLKSGIWVGMGIPFCLAFTLISAFMMGYTINNMTLAAIIIVLGIVVDDAIIVAENISRKQSLNESLAEVHGTTEVLSPVLASVLTTCAAFVPLYFFEGRFGILIKYIPAIVFLMLLASLFESFFILPAHMKENLPFKKLIEKWFPNGGFSIKRKFLVSKTEKYYSVLLSKTLRLRSLVLVGFALLLAGSYFLFSTKMNYVMFPREESKDFRVKVVAPEDTGRYEMARLITKVENLFINDKHDVIVGVRSSIGQSRRGGQVKENEGSIVVEVVPPDERSLSLNELFKIWQKNIDQLEGFKEVRMLKSRFGSDSGSAIEIEIQENDDDVRNKVAEILKKKLSDLQDLANVEIERPLVKNEFRLAVDKNEVSRLGVDYIQMAATLRSYIEGSILYTLNSGAEEVDVRFTSQDSNKKDIEKVLALTVSNKEGYLIPIKNLVKPIEGQKPANIQRTNYKRTTSVYADLKPESKTTPLEIATLIERDIFPYVSRGLPSVGLSFRGEVEDSRESQDDFSTSILLAVGIIYILLIFLFNSVWTPLLIGAIIPFGMVGVIFAFWSHGMSQYGFFAVIGALGMLGVVINDSIVLIDKLELSLKEFIGSKLELFELISKTSASRLRAIIVTTVTTVAGLFPTAYGLAGYDAMLAEMMLSMCWGLLFGMFITLVLVPCLYSFYFQLRNYTVKS